MNVAVLYHKDNPKAPRGIPPAHPFMVREIGDALEFTDEQGRKWDVMTLPEFVRMGNAAEVSYKVWEKKYCDHRGHPHKGLRGLFVRLKDHLGLS